MNNAACGIFQNLIRIKNECRRDALLRTGKLILHGKNPPEHDSFSIIPLPGAIFNGRARRRAGEGQKRGKDKNR